MRRSQGDALLLWLRSRGKEGVRVLRRFPLPSCVNQKQHSSKIRWKLKEKKKTPLKVFKKYFIQTVHYVCTVHGSSLIKLRPICAKMTEK